MMTIIISPYRSVTFIYLYDVSERGRNVKREPGSFTKISITVPRSAKIKVGKGKGINPSSDDSLTPPQRYRSSHMEGEVRDTKIVFNNCLGYSVKVSLIMIGRRGN